MEMVFSAIIPVYVVSGPFREMLTSTSRASFWGVGLPECWAPACLTLRLDQLKTTATGDGSPCKVLLEQIVDYGIPILGT